MSRLTLLIAVVFAAACSGPSPVASRDDVERPMRIVSLDFCADQYVLKLADRSQILALSPDAVKDFSYMRDEAAGLRSVRAIAEDVLILKPDLVVRSYGGGPNAAAFFERAGVPVLQVGWSSTVNGEAPGSIASVILSMADGLGQTDKGRALVADFHNRLNRVQSEPSLVETLYMTRAGVTTGEGTLMHDMLLNAGLQNFTERPGWQSLPLEKLVYDRPAMVAAAFFSKQDDPRYRWSSSRHPIATRELERTNTVSLEGAWTACGAWYILDAIEALHAGAAR